MATYPYPGEVARFSETHCFKMKNQQKSKPPDEEPPVTIHTIQYDFSRYLIIENLPWNVKSSDAVWGALKLDGDERLRNRRLYRDPHKMMSLTAVLIYINAALVTETAARLDGTIVLNTKIQVTPADVRLQDMIYLESEIVKYSQLLKINSTNYIQGLVSVISQLKEPKRTVRELFRKFGTIKNIKVFPEGKSSTYVLVFFNFRSEAYASEIAYNRVTKERCELRVKAENYSLSFVELQNILSDLKKQWEIHCKLTKKPGN